MKRTVIAGLSAALPLLALAWAMELFRAVGLALFAVPVIASAVGTFGPREATIGASGGAFWGFLIGLIFFNPLLGVAVGAAAGGLSGALSDYGINDTFMKDVASMLQPGQAALFMMVRTTASDRVLENLAEHGGRVLRTNLDTSHEQKVRDAFDAAHAEAKKVKENE